MTGFSAIAVAEDGGYDGRDVQFAGVSRIVGSKWAQLPILTVGLCGVQILWSVEFSYAPPYLLSLGLTKSHMAIVFLAGPVSGLIMQPLIGVIADNSKSRFGRRRPYILLGIVVCVSAMLLLGFTRPFASIFLALGSSANNSLTIFFAIWAICCIDLSINAIQAVDRALIVDSVPTAQQATGNAWAARMLGIGSVVGFFVANVDLRSTFSIAGTQLEIFSVIASLLLIASHVLTIFSVKERVLLSSSHSGRGFRREIKDIWDNLLTLPPAIRQICMIQFFAWIAWFPILFYTTTYIGDLYKYASPLPLDDDAAQRLDDEGTRLGSRALFYNSLVALLSNFVLPFFITRKTEEEMEGPVGRISSFFNRFQVHLCELWAFSHLVCALCMFATFFTSSVAGATVLITITGFSWAITQWAPFSLLAEEILADFPSTEVDDAASIRLVDSRSRRRSVEPRSAGIIWDEGEERRRLVDERSELDADEEENEEENEHKDGDAMTARKYKHHANGSMSRSSSIDDDRRGSFLNNVRARQSHSHLHMTLEPASAQEANGYVADGEDDADNDGLEHSGLQGQRPGSLQAKAGIILGIHNLFLTGPQLLMTGVSSVIFAIFDPDKSVLHGHHPGNIKPGNGTLSTGSTKDAQNTTSSLLHHRDVADSAGPNSVAIVFRIGGVSLAVAFLLSWRLARELKRR